ncbi:MAG: winged helix-turn-helix domain-containing protein [Thermoactinospora sp.]|nr:winged helix-turn-helix domain-containing protein [Thermoactinospora sp.]
MSNTLAISERDARRMAINAQHLAGPVPDLHQVLGSLRCLQLDPIDVVARSHQTVLWSRLHTRIDLDELIYRDQVLFEYWAHAASIVLAEDLPIHHYLMRRYPGSKSAEGKRLAAWVEANDKLRTKILDELAEKGPLPSRAIEDEAEQAWRSSGWTEGRNVERMLDILLIQGKVRVAGRKGRARLWGLARWPEFEPLSDREVTRQAAGRALKALGVGRRRDVFDHFTRGRYPDLAEVLETSPEIRKVTVGGEEGWYAHEDSLDQPEWQPREATILSPFDNLICDRNRTERLWGFVFRNEMYVPKAKRQYGYYVMPVLAGDELVGRIAPRADRKAGRLVIEGVYTDHDVTRALERLEAFALGRSFGDSVSP